MSAIEHKEFYIFTHPETQHWLEARHERIRAAFDTARSRMAPIDQAAE
jgi:hypothetical protein